MVEKKKDYFDIDKYLKELKKESQDCDVDQLLEQIGAEFERGDFSSLDPEFPSQDFIDAMKRDEQRLKEWDAKKKREKAQKSPSKKRRFEKGVSI